MCAACVCAALMQCLGGVTNDPKKMEMIISKSFGYFDKDKSGYIDAAEAKACANQVCTAARFPRHMCTLHA